MATFGERFKYLRLERDITQEGLINEFNKKYNYSFSKAAVSQYENDKRIPEIDALMAFASFFDVTLDYLLGRSEFKKGRLLTKDELREFLPDDEVDNQDWGITVDDLNELSEETKQQIKEVLRKAGYLKKG